MRGNRAGLHVTEKTLLDAMQWMTRIVYDICTCVCVCVCVCVYVTSFPSLFPSPLAHTYALSLLPIRPPCDHRYRKGGQQDNPSKILCLYCQSPLSQDTYTYLFTRTRIAAATLPYRLALPPPLGILLRKKECLAALQWPGVVGPGAGAGGGGIKR
ncbi:hypothetical protein M441DRAFT_336166 [Trichoderma asperellum CBS 433.97]|uniref:Uncharacterized protein n=1 Tax=Trichoderma asperellum (strain ATCC 204424 / CBS 433.97 / NBRC 101777) TaxID=1042311 RepID=A0A2T3ZG59_TRIA4|nr:hypothetical protein M441DRAFT_336166 [Trichoderma asperellum CBS 433.97]PTB43792.1 hypothetical protein M441DRAFT_336166 [Trichoderma asperellum CBS 433.97]